MTAGVVSFRGESFRMAALAVRQAWLGEDVGGVLIPLGLRIALERLAECDPTEGESPNVRRTDPATSHAGAASVAMRSGSQRHQLLRAFGRHPSLNADKAWAATAIPEGSCYWKRVSELAQAGLIEPTGATFPGRSGEAQTVYRITDAGLAVLRAQP